MDGNRLVFGAWDSTGAAGGLGNKFARASASEIVGVKAVYGVRTASRLDPLGIEKGDIYESKVDGSYVVLKAEAQLEGDTEVVFNRKAVTSKDTGTPAGITHGNIPPDIVRYDDFDKAAKTPDVMRRAKVSVTDRQVSKAPHPMAAFLPCWDEE